MNRIKLPRQKGRQRRSHFRELPGSTGKVLEVLARKKNRVLIEGVRMIKKHLRKSQDNPAGHDRGTRRPDSHFECETGRTHREGEEEEQSESSEGEEEQVTRNCSHPE